ncbi:hypothetical protein ACP4OV_021227 [Aristida adscensionis]
MNPRTEFAHAAPTTSVFEPGKLAVEPIRVDHKNKGPKPPIKILGYAPKDAGDYPVVIFLHGFLLENGFYKEILEHVASFGFIMVAPQFHQLGLNMMDQSDDDDIAAAAELTVWLAEGLQHVLPNGVKPDLSKLALAGHSRGGHTAFALVLGHGDTKNLKFSAIIGVDPVAGQDESSQISPKILTGDPSSWNIGMPALVIGTGLGDDPKKITIPWIPFLHWELPACAPKNVNHWDFYNECKPPCYYFVTEDYGHLDMLDDDAVNFITFMMSQVCKKGTGPKDLMRRTVAGIMVAFLKAKLNKEEGDLEAILKVPNLAPAKLDPVEHRTARLT